MRAKTEKQDPHEDLLEKWGLVYFAAVWLFGLISIGWVELRPWVLLALWGPMLIAAAVVVVMACLQRLWRGRQT